jgi:hypothetical protein
MHQDVQDLIRQYAREMTVLEALLQEFRDKFHYLDSVQFDTLDDMVKFVCFAQLRLNGVHIIQFLGLSECQCICHRDSFIFIHSSIWGTADEVMTMANVFRFIENGDIVCEHEKVAGFLVREETIHIIVKRKLQ